MQIPDLLELVAKLRWALRKLQMGVSPGSFVLEVGSGGNPHPFSDVLLEKYITNEHRLKAVRIDREFILADACELPFKEKVFDFAIAFHVLEHVENPLGFLSELSRVAKSGYIETPNILYEQLNPFDVHLTEVAMGKSELLIQFKSAAIPNQLLHEVGALRNSQHWRKFFRRNPESFHVCYKWNGAARGRLLNPSDGAAWFKAPETTVVSEHTPQIQLPSEKITIRGAFARALRAYAALFKRKRSIRESLACPKCKGPLLFTKAHCHCDKCRLKFSTSPIADFLHPLPYGEDNQA